MKQIYKIVLEQSQRSIKDDKSNKMEQSPKKTNLPQIKQPKLKKHEEQGKQKGKQKQQEGQLRKDQKQIPIIDELKMKKGASFWSIEQNFQQIYDNFNLLSYFATRFDIKILQRVAGNHLNNCNIIQEFTFKNSKKFIMVENLKHPFSKANLPKLLYPLQIFYSIYDQDLSQGQEFKLNLKQKVADLKVEFNTEIIPLEKEIYHFRQSQRVVEKHKQYIHIEITDLSGWIKENLQKIQKKTHHRRFAEFFKANSRQIQYFYIQPQNERFKIISQEHISIAIQGGGCKGVPYIGAYKAIKELKQKAKITSIIGSSAGAIFGLGMCCGLQPDFILNEIVQNYFSQFIKDRTKFSTQFIQTLMSKSLDQVTSCLRQLNIVQERLIQIIQNTLKDRQFQREFLKLIGQLSNAELQKLFSYNQEPGNGQQQKDLNLAGLLSGSLMSGHSLNEMAQVGLRQFLTKICNQKGQKFVILSNNQRYRDILGSQMPIQNKLKKISPLLTMKEFYDLTGIQFTATAVDATNHVLRFLNHKTSPGIPACCAVQMSGSFPIAFKAQYWQKQWGKYYIHFENIRREVDLTGCQLIDGGTLANFPIKYLDNQDMRPMYFSHVKTNKTIMYGIGLKADITENKEDGSKEIKSKMLQIFMSKMGLAYPLTSWIKTKLGCWKPKPVEIDTSDKDPFKALTSIPLIRFIIELLQTFCISKDNLIEQCFSHSSYETNTVESYQKEIANRPSFQELSDRIQQLQNELNELLIGKRESLFRRQMLPKNKLQQVFRNNIKYLIEQCSRNIVSEVDLIEILQTLQFNFKTFLSYLTAGEVGTQLKEEIFTILRNKIFDQFNFQVKPINLITKIFDIFQQMKKQKTFIREGFQEDLLTLKKIANVFLKFFEGLREKISNDSQKMTKSQDLQSHFSNVLELIYAIESQQIYNFGTALRSFRNENQEGRKKNIKSIGIAYSKLFSLTITTPIPMLNKLFKKVRRSVILSLFINHQSYTHRNQIKSYTLLRIINYSNKMMVNQKKQIKKVPPPDGIHIALQSIALSELYFHEYFLLVRDALRDYNQQLNLKKDEDKLKITTLTATGYHSIIMFLHASDLSEQRIGHQAWKIRDLIQVNKTIQQRLKNGDWANITPVMLRKIQNEAVRRKKDIFQFIEEEIVVQQNIDEDQQLIGLKNSVEKKIQAIKIQNQQMVQAIQASLNYVVDNLVEIQQQQSNYRSKFQKFLKKLSLHKPPFNYKLKTKEDPSYGLKKIWQFFLQKFQDIIKYLFFSSPLVVEHITQMLRPQERANAWKSIMLQSILSGEEIKSYVKSILNDLGLGENTTLKDFYQFSSKKIQLNFSVVQDSYVYVFNHITRPNMPIWAAVLSATSIPDFYPPIFDRSEWRVSKEKDYKKRKVISYFGQNAKPYRLLCSSQILTRLPLDLLLNGKFQSQITQKKNEIFLIFNFSEFKLQQITNQVIKSMKITPLTTGQIISKFISFKEIIFEKVCGGKLGYSSQSRNIQGIKLFGSIQSVQQIFKMLNLYVESHDNLILRLYKRELIQMPIRLDTFDFHLINRKKVLPNGNEVQELSDLCHDSIMQAYFILSQKILSTYNPEKQGYLQKKHAQGLKKKMTINLELQQVNKISEVKSQQKQNKKNAQIQNNIDEKYSSLVLTYFRIESMKNKEKQAEKMGEINQMQSSYRQIKPMSRQDLSLESSMIIMDENRKNFMKLRFLSILNTSREMYEKYYIYYRADQSLQYRSSMDRKQNTTEYIRVTNETLILEERQNRQLNLKFEFPSADEREIRTRYFTLDLSQLFALNEKFQKNNQRFGYVYQLQLNKKQFEQDQVLKPHESYKTDYMNRNQSNKACPVIGIKYDIKNTYFEGLICEKCLQTFEIQRNKNSKRCEYRCKKCDTQRKPISQQYKIDYNPIKGYLKCKLGHSINKTSHSDQAFEQRNQTFCDLCGRVNVHQYWFDAECNTKFCEPCRVQNMDMNIQD